VSVLLQELSALESELNRADTRRDRSRMKQLLHPDFEEFARSGRKYSRDEVLSEFTVETNYPSVVSTEFSIADLSEGVALLTYRSAHQNASGELHRHTRRSSLWVRTDAGWQMRFHQGTPIDG